MSKIISSGRTGSVPTRTVTAPPATKLITTDVPVYRDVVSVDPALTVRSVQGRKELSLALPAPGGVISARPVAGSYTGQTYFDTVSGLLSVWNGTYWLPVSGVGSRGMVAESDFVTALGQPAPNTTTGNFGTGAGVTDTGVASPDSTRMGIRTLSTGTQALGRAQMFMSASSALDAAPCVAGVCVLEMAVRIPVLSVEGVEGVRCQFGWVGSAPSTNVLDHPNQMTFDYDLSVSPNWIVQSASGSVRTKVTSAIPVDTDWVKLIVVSTSTTVSFYTGRDDEAPTLVGTIDSDLPTTVVMGLAWRIYKAAGASALMVVADWFRVIAAWSASRV